MYNSIIVLGYSVIVLGY